MLPFYMTEEVYDKDGTWMCGECASDDSPLGCALCVSMNEKEE